jgi:hypothetical protein
MNELGIITDIPYDGRLGYYRPNNLSLVKTFPTKKLAQDYAASIGWNKCDVAKVGSRFWSSWGLRDVHGRWISE